MTRFAGIGGSAIRIWSSTTLAMLLSAKPCLRSYLKASSRSGPILPCVPASASVWQPPHSADEALLAGGEVGGAARDPAGAAAGGGERRGEDGEGHEPPHATSSTITWVIGTSNRSRACSTTPRSSQLDRSGDFVAMIAASGPKVR